MNYKLEKFWNVLYVINLTAALSMNYKLEKFWNFKYAAMPLRPEQMNYKLEKFWNLRINNISYCSLQNEL